MDKRWSIYIDIEGFGALYDKENIILLALGDLMEGIFLIGSKCYPETPNRIFAHQTGDGFVIVSEFYSESLEIPVAISIALLRHISLRGRFAKASIAEGEFAGIEGCYPRRIQEAKETDNRVFMGRGIMTIFPVMGTALINSVAISKVSPSGSLLTICKGNSDRLPKGCIIHEIEGSEVSSIDWVHSSFPLLEQVQNKAELRKPDSSTIKTNFYKYFNLFGFNSPQLAAIIGG